MGCDAVTEIAADTAAVVQFGTVSSFTLEDLLACLSNAKAKSWW